MGQQLQQILGSMRAGGQMGQMQGTAQSPQTPWAKLGQQMGQTGQDIDAARNAPRQMSQGLQPPPMTQMGGGMPQAGGRSMDPQMIQMLMRLLQQRGGGGRIGGM